MKHICIGILAHVDAGKTTLSEALLYETGTIRSFGRVDHGDTFLDTDRQERERGITIFSKQAIMELPGCTVTLLDTPGHTDFSAEMERTLQVLDYAVLVISGTAGVQSHTHTLWQLLRRYQIPTFLFVNKMDLETADREALLSQLQKELSESCVDFSAEPESRDEQIALCSEAAMEQYLADGRVDAMQIRSLISGRKLFPCLFGSALRRTGVDALLRSISELTVEPEYGHIFGARVFKIMRDEKGVRLSFLKVTGGTLRVKQPLQIGEQTEKADQIRLYSGSRFTLLQEASAGTVCAVAGLTAAKPGDVIGNERSTRAPVMQPVLTYRLRLTDGGDEAEAFRTLSVLEEEDPQLHLVWDAQLREIRLQLMGFVQMEILQTLIERRFGLRVSFDEGNIVYKETIAASVEGVGHYEPLRHYAEVHLLLEPSEPGSGLQFDTMCPTDALTLNWQRLILTHLAEKTHRGVLTGAPLTDLRITLISGRMHVKHTEGGDFRQATYRAVRQGLRKAQSILLEPWYHFRLELPANTLGHAMTDLERMGADVSAPEQDGTTAILQGSAPVRALRSYQQEVTAYTRGKGHLSCTVGGYRPCADQEAVVREIGYDPERDLDNPSSSVFCGHGAGFEVKWDKVDDMAHLPLLRFSARAPEQPAQHIVRAVPAGGAPELEKELLTIFERTYGPIQRRDVRLRGTLASSQKRELIERIEPVDEFVLVDGYNIIFAWDELREIAKTSLDTARHILMNLLCNYQGYRGCAVILVFDAYKVPENLGSAERYHNIYLVYTRHAETADQYIERFSYELRGRRLVRVATSDSLEQLIVLGHGAQRVSAQSFHDEVMSVAKQIEQAIHANG